MIARECPEQDQKWRRHAGRRDNKGMPVPSRRLKDLIEGTVDHHASQRWPALEEVTISWRGSYGYLTGYLSGNDERPRSQAYRVGHRGSLRRDLSFLLRVGPPLF